MKKSQVFLLGNIVFIAGIFLGYFWKQQIIFFYIILLALITSFFYFNSPSLKKLIKTIILFGVVFSVGIFRSGISPIKTSDDISWYNSKKVEIIGVVCEEPDERIRSIKLTLCAKEKIENKKTKKISGKILATMRLYPKYLYGDKLLIAGEIESPKSFDDFAYDKYLARYGIYSIAYHPQTKIISRSQGNVLYSKILEFKNFIKTKINLNIPEPQASIMNAFFLGTRGGIPDELNQAFKTSGIIHLIAISGSHITLLMLMLESLLPFFYISRNKAFYIIFVFIIFYIVLIGAPASAVRAGIMGAVILFAKKIGRLSKSLNVLFFTGAIMLLHNPTLIIDDIGFQLSFLALWGIVEFIPRWEKRFSHVPDFFGLKNILFMTVASQIATFPVLAYNFKTLSIIAPITNIFILPMFTYFMGVTFISLWLSLFIQKFSIIIFFVPYFFVSYIISASEFFSKIPFASVPLEQFSLEVMAISFILIFYFTYWYQRKIKINDSAKKDRSKIIPYIRYISMAIFAGFFIYITLPNIFQKKIKNPTAIFFNVGQGDSALIQTSSGKTALIDGGPNNVVLYKLGEYYPWWKRDIDAVVISHPHADHITGLIETIARYNVKKIIMAGIEQKTFENKTLLQMVQEKKIPIEIIDSKRKAAFDKDMDFKFLYPKKNMQSIPLKDEDINDASIVLEVLYGKKSILFTGDAGVKVQKEIMDDLSQVQIIKIPHQGSVKNFYKEFYEKLKPGFSIISVGENNYGHPSQRVIRELERTGSKVYVTKEDGDIIIEFGERGISVAASK